MRPGRSWKSSLYRLRIFTLSGDWLSGSVKGWATPIRSDLLIHYLVPGPPLTKSGQILPLSVRQIRSTFRWIAYPEYSATM